MLVSELLAKPENWCQGYGTRSKEGNQVGLFSDEACSYCLYTSVIKCYPTYLDRSIILMIIENEIRESIPRWNDNPNRTHNEVLELVKKLGI